jgi:hypothetical protein
MSGLYYINLVSNVTGYGAHGQGSFNGRGNDSSLPCPDWLLGSPNDLFHGHAGLFLRE